MNKTSLCTLWLYIIKDHSASRRLSALPTASPSEQPWLNIFPLHTGKQENSNYQIYSSQWRLSTAAWRLPTSKTKLLVFVFFFSRLKGILLPPPPI